MKTASLIFSGLFLLRLSSVAQGTFNRFDCNSYGNHSDCTASDNTWITCYNGSYSECRVELQNGFLTSGQGPGALLINWLVERHPQHVTDKAIDNASATVLLTIRHSMHLMDLSAFTSALTPYMPAEQKETAQKMTADLSDQSRQFSMGVSLFASTWNNADRESFLRSAKKLDQLYESGRKITRGKCHHERPILLHDCSHPEAVRGIGRHLSLGRFLIGVPAFRLLFFVPSSYYGNGYL